MQKNTIFLFPVFLAICLFIKFPLWAEKLSIYSGEKIIYDVRLGKINLGKAVFQNLPMAELDGRKVNLVTFETKLTKFSDLEKIYSDADTFLPLRVERLVSNWPFRETIIEEYDQKNFILTIRKLKGRKEEKRVIKKKSPINNAILLPYYVRDKARLKVGYNLAAQLPGQEFTVYLTAVEEVRVPAGKFMAYHFVSKPKKFEIWLSADERKIPLKIKGLNMLRYTLVMRDYQP